MKTLSEIESLLGSAKSPHEFFGDDPDKTKAQFLHWAHPDRHVGEADRAASIFDKIQKLYDQLKVPSVVVKSPKREYQVVKLLTAGDVADLYLATSVVDGASKDYLLKISRVPGGDKLLDNERKVLTGLLKAAATSTYSHYLPTLVESFLAKDKIQKRVNVFVPWEGTYSLEEVHAKHPKLEGRHLAWMFKRMLTVLGFTQANGVVHGAVLPCHVRLHAANHGLQLVGWGQSVPIGSQIKTVSTKYRSWYPKEVNDKKPATGETDLYMAAKCLVYLSGGNPETNDMPSSIPIKIRRFVRSCLMDGASMRPSSSWGLLDEFDVLLEEMYGPPKFHELTMES